MAVTITVKTFSIVAYEPQENSWGIAVASKFLAVGSIVPYAKANVGAIATQSAANLLYGERGLELMKQGFRASDTLAKLLGEDKTIEDRQVGIVDANGNAASFTGQKCSSWAGGLTGDHYAIQGNMLASEEVIMSMEAAFRTIDGELSDKLFAALAAGDLAGGDRRGKQSAAILVVKLQGSYGGYTDRYVDLRVDNHPEPVKELGELLRLHRIFLGSSSREEKIKIEGELIKEFQVLLKRLGYYTGEVNSIWDRQTKEAFANFIDVENLERRVDIDKAVIASPALDYIHHRFSG